MPVASSNGQFKPVDLRVLGLHLGLRLGQPINVSLTRRRHPLLSGDLRPAVLLDGGLECPMCVAVGSRLVFGSAEDPAEQTRRWRRERRPVGRCDGSRVVAEIKVKGRSRSLHAAKVERVHRRRQGLGEHRFQLTHPLLDHGGSVGRLLRPLQQVRLAITTLLLFALTLRFPRRAKGSLFCRAALGRQPSCSVPAA
jgi:hypothetical protein